MNHKMHLDGLPFTQFRDNLRNIEVRLNDQKRQQLKVGDQVLFVNRDDELESLVLQVEALYPAQSFEQLFESFPAQEFGAENKEDLIKSIYKHYSKEDEQKHGVLGIRLK